MYDNYLERMAMGVRRLRDPRKGTVSLTNLLRRIGGNPRLIDRHYYFAHFPPEYPRVPRATTEERAALRAHFIDREYDRLVGPGLDCPCGALIDLQLAWLEMFGTKVVDYATKRIAHHDEQPPSDFPDLEDVDAFIDYAEELLRGYIVLVNGVSTFFDANFQYDWLAPLRVTWLPDEAVRSGGFLPPPDRS
jgi:hypothetical protein